MYFRCKSFIRYFLTFCELSSHFLNSVIVAHIFNLDEIQFIFFLL